MFPVWWIPPEIQLEVINNPGLVMLNLRLLNTITGISDLDSLGDHYVSGVFDPQPRYVNFNYVELYCIVDSGGIDSR